jgi:hypothetical protein
VCSARMLESERGEISRCSCLCFIAFWSDGERVYGIEFLRRVAIVCRS